MPVAGLPATLRLLRSHHLLYPPWLESFVCTFAVEKAPINLSQAMCSSSGSEEASAPMYLTNDRLGDRGDNRIFSSGVSVQAATSQVASRGQQLPVISSPAGRVKVGPGSSLLSLTAALRAVPCRSSGVTRIHLSKGNSVSRFLCFPFLCPSGKSCICVPISTPDDSSLSVAGGSRHLL